MRAPAARATQRRQDCGRGGPGSCNPGYPGAGKDPTSPCDPGATGDAGLAAPVTSQLVARRRCTSTPRASSPARPARRGHHEVVMPRLGSVAASRSAPGSSLAAATSRNSTGMVPAYAQQPHIRCSAKFDFCLLRKISNLLPPCSIPHSIPHSIDNGKSW